MKRFIVFILSVYTTLSWAVLEVTISKQDKNTFPIIISDFLVVGDANQGKIIAKIIRNNLVLLI